MYPGMNPFGARQAQAYARVAVETQMDNASPHRLVAMLFDGLLDALATASGAIRGGQLAAKGNALRRAIGIVELGLKAGLNLEQGGALARDLNELYAYVLRRLTHANVRNDADAVDECARLIHPLKTAWDEIGPQVEPRRTP